MNIFYPVFALMLRLDYIIGVSVAATIVALLSFEVGAMVILLGAQVIAEYERMKGELPEIPGGADLSTGPWTQG